MELYNETAKTKTGELRVTRPIGALLVSMSQGFSALTNETITVFVERANGDSTNLFTDLPLKAFIAASTAGSPAVFENNDELRALCEICEEGNISLQDTETIKIKMDGLKSAVTYALFGIEYPHNAQTAVSIERRPVLSEEVARRFDVADQELMIIEGVDNILELEMSFGSHTVKYLPEELKILSRDFDPVKLVHVGLAPATSYDLPALITMPLIGCQKIDVKKQAGNPVTFYFKNDKIPA